MVERTKVLLIEDHNSLSMSMMFNLESEFNFHVIDCHTVAVAERMLEINDDVKLFIFPAETNEGSTFEFFKSIKTRFPDAITICTDTERSKAWDEVPGHSVCRKEVLTPLAKLINEIFKVDETAEKSDRTQVSLKALSCLDGLREDAYIMLPSGRLLKLFSAGDVITHDDIERYSHKGVSHLYLDKEACKWIIRQLEKHVDEMVSSSDATVDLEDAYENDAREFFEDVDEETYVENVFQQEKEFVQEVHKNTRKVVKNIKQNRSLMKLLGKIQFEKGKGSFVQNRIKMVSSISCALAQAMGWNSDMTYEKLIYAAHVHDIMLLDNPNLAKIQTLEEAEKAKRDGTITAVEFERFHKHTAHAYELVRKDPTAPPDAAIMVTQHHELPGGHGFPQKLSTARINAFTAILAVAIDVSNYLLLHKERKMEIYFDLYASKFRGGPFVKVLEALREIGNVK